MPEASQKVAETAEITKKPEKTWQKVAETAKIPKTAPKTQP